MTPNAKGKAAAKPKAKSMPKSKPNSTPPKSAKKLYGMAATKAKPPLKPGKDGVIRLSGGNPQIAKAEGDAPVQAYIAAMPDWKRAVGKELDALVVRNVPNVRKAVKWNSPFYGVEGQGWFMSYHVYTKAVKVTFFSGTSLRPVPPGGVSKEARWVDVHQDDLDEGQMTTWIKQAAALPGWDPSEPY